MYRRRRNGAGHQSHARFNSAMSAFKNAGAPPHQFGIPEFPTLNTLPHFLLVTAINITIFFFLKKQPIRPEKQQK
jgi:hypothetical protein